MTVVSVSSLVPHPRDVVLAWHLRPGALTRLTPPWAGARILEAGPVREGAGVRARLYGMSLASTHTVVDPPRRFVDEGQAGPVQFTHEHVFNDARGGTRVTDRVTFTPALLGVATYVDRAFRWRHDRLALDLARHARFEGLPRLRVGITGASGLLGHDLGAFLSTGGHTVQALTRAGKGPRWDPETGEISAGPLDAVVHLAGEPISAGRWTPRRKASILRSRVPATRKLCEALAAMDTPPATLLCASAIGLYGDRGDELLDERSAPGRGFLAEVVAAWEEACAPAREAGIRVVNLRTGIVLTPDGGALEKMLLPFRLGLGGPMGSGAQWMSWISQEDWVGAVHHLLLGEVQGPVNLTAPGPVPNRTFARTLGHVLHRPAIAPLPAFALRAAMGEMAEELLLYSQRVTPGALQKSGFSFAHTTLESALQWELGNPSRMY